MEAYEYHKERLQVIKYIRYYIINRSSLKQYLNKFSEIKSNSELFKYTIEKIIKKKLQNLSFNTRLTYISSISRLASYKLHIGISMQIFLSCSCSLFDIRTISIHYYDPTINNTLPSYHNCTNITSILILIYAFIKCFP